MNTFQLECFFCVASTLNFARAAEKLNVTQPAITHQIKSLENELHVLLFNRSVRNVTLTPEGEVLLPEVKDLLVKFTGIKNKFSKTDYGTLINFQIGCMSNTLYALLPDVLHELSLCEPNIHPTLKTFSASHLIKVMEENLVDVALGIKEKLPKGSNIEYTEILKTPLVCMCNESHPLSDCNHISLKDVDDYPLVFFRPTVCSTELISLQLKTGKNKCANSIYLCDDLSAATSLVSADLGVALLPLVYIPDALKGIKTVTVDDYPEMSFGVYYKSGGNALQKNFVRMLKRMHRQKNVKY